MEKRCNFGWKKSLATTTGEKVTKRIKDRESGSGSFTECTHCNLTAFLSRRLLLSADLSLLWGAENVTLNVTVLDLISLNVLPKIRSQHLPKAT